MGYGNPDVYYQPEHFNLTQVAMIDYSTGSYEFDYRIVWEHPERGLLTARDSGCSCPSPFEGYTSLDDLDAVDIDELTEEVQNKLKPEYEYGSVNISEMQAEDFLREVRVAL